MVLSTFLKSLISIIIFFVFLFIFISGIGRHDVHEQAYLDLAKESQFDCVGQVYRNGKPVASCVLIDNKFILSAAHVFVESDKVQDTLILDNGDMMVRNVPVNHRIANPGDFYFVFGEHKLYASKIRIHPNFLDKEKKINHHFDLSLVTLTRSKHNIKPAKINLKKNELSSKVVGVGYGASGKADKPHEVIRGKKKIAGENVVDSLGGAKLHGDNTQLLCDFDHPRLEKFNKIGSKTAMPLEYTASGGDSGGGLFRRVNKHNWELIGVFSSYKSDLKLLSESNSYYGTLMFWTRVSVFKSWIEEQMAKDNLLDKK